MPCAASAMAGLNLCESSVENWFWSRRLPPSEASNSASRLLTGHSIHPTPSTGRRRGRSYWRPFGASMTARFGYWRFAAGCRCLWKLPSDGTEHSRNKWPPAKQNTAKMFALLWTRAKGNDYYELRVRFAQASAKRTLRKERHAFEGHGAADRVSIRRSVPLAFHLSQCGTGARMSDSPTPQIQIWHIDRFVFYARNPRKNDAAVDRMCASIREFGLKLPVLARSDATVIDGHLRLKSARKLGITEIPVILCDEWTDT